MPKPSSNPDKARAGGSKLEPGVYEITGAKYANLKTHESKPNQLYLVLDAVVCDKDGDRVKGADPVEIQFSFGKESHENFSPGKITGPDDTDPQDMGLEIDQEGNTVYCQEGSLFSKSCAAIVFAESLTKLGYPKDVLDQTYAPNYVGLKLAMDSLDVKTLNDKYGTRLNTKPLPDGGTVTYKIATRWLNANQAVGKAAPASAKAASKAEAVAPEKPVKTDWSAMSDEQLATACIQGVAASRDVVKAHSQLVGLTTNFYTAKAKMPADRLKDVQALVKNPAWAKKAVQKAGGVIGEEPKYIVFTAPVPADSEEFDEDGNPV